MGVRAEGGADLPGAASGAGTSAAAAEEPEDLGTRARVAHAEAGWAVAHPPCAVHVALNSPVGAPQRGHSDVVAEGRHGRLVRRPLPGELHRYVVGSGTAPDGTGDPPGPPTRRSGTVFTDTERAVAGPADRRRRQSDAHGSRTIAIRPHLAPRVPYHSTADRPGRMDHALSTSTGLGGSASRLRILPGKPLWPGVAPRRAELRNNELTLSSSGPVGKQEMVRQWFPERVPPENPPPVQVRPSCDRRRRKLDPAAEPDELTDKAAGGTNVPARSRKHSPPRSAYSVPRVILDPIAGGVLSGHPGLPLRITSRKSSTAIGDHCCVRGLDGWGSVPVERAMAGPHRGMRAGELRAAAVSSGALRSESRCTCSEQNTPLTAFPQIRGVFMSGSGGI